MDRWLELNMIGGDPWILPVWGAANDAADRGRVPPLTDELGQLGLHISIRLDLLPRIAQRIMEEAFEAYAAARGHGPEHVFTPTRQGYALPIDDNLKFRLITDIDAFLFEVNASWELMRKLFQLVRNHVGRPIPRDRNRVTNELRVALAGQSEKWFEWLDRHRNFFAHEGTPYLSVAVKSDDSFELLITKEHPINFADPSKFFRYSELVGLARGFDEAKRILQRHLIELFR